MKQEQTELLLKDLCARLPYGVKVNDDIQGDFTLIGLTKERIFTTCEVEGCHNDFPIEDIKPYLFPLSSMTEEQKNQLKEIWDTDMNKALDYTISGEEELSDLSQLSATGKIIDWFIENHFDYRGLIEKSLALDATNKNIY